MSINRIVQVSGRSNFHSQPHTAPISARCPFLPSALLLAALSAHSVGSGLPSAGLSKWDRVQLVTGYKCEAFPSLLILFLLLLGLPPSLLPSQHRPQTKSHGFSSKVVLSHSQPCPPFSWILVIHWVLEHSVNTWRPVLKLSLVIPDVVILNKFLYLFESHFLSVQWE